MKAKNKLVYGVGVNDADYVINPSFDGKTVKCPFYFKWLGMLERAYSRSFHERYPTYTECSVHSDWHTLSTFKSWMELQNWEGMQLDKDLLVKGNKVYSSDTCVFVTREVNTFMTESKATRGALPLGVSVIAGRYKARLTVKGKVTSLGSFNAPEEAHQAYRAAKWELAVQLASEQSDPRVAAALIERYKL